MASFFKDRKIKLKAWEKFSRDFKVENDTPHGSIISPVLFSIMINDILYVQPLKDASNQHYVQMMLQYVLEENCFTLF